MNVWIYVFRVVILWVGLGWCCHGVFLTCFRCLRIAVACFGWCVDKKETC